MSMAAYHVLADRLSEFKEVGRDKSPLFFFAESCLIFIYVFAKILDDIKFICMYIGCLNEKDW